MACARVPGRRLDDVVEAGAATQEIVPSGAIIEPNGARETIAAWAPIDKDGLDAAFGERFRKFQRFLEGNNGCGFRGDERTMTAARWSL